MLFRLHFMEEIVRHQWNFQWVSKQLVKAFNFWLSNSYFLKLVRAIAGNHNFTPLDNQRNYFAEGTFCGFVFFFKSGSHELRVASVQERLCNHCHPWPSVITSRLVCWLLPALLFSQVLLTGTCYSRQRPISRSSSLLCFFLFLHLVRTILAALAT